jgi:hypothetical protein
LSRNHEKSPFFRVLPFLLAFGTGAAAGPVRSGEVRVLRSERALECPPEDELVRAALALGTAPVQPAGEPVSIVVVFDGDGSSLRALVSARGSKTGERELETEGADCAKLAEAVAVVVAVLLDLVPPDTVASSELPREEPPEPPPPLPAPPPAPEPMPAPRPARVVVPPRVPARTEPLVPWLRGEGGLAVGLLGGVVSPWLGGAAGVRLGRWQLGLGGAWVGPRDVPFDPVPGTRIDLALAYGRGEGCLWFADALRRDWDIGVCAEFAAGVLTGAGRGFDNPETRHELWLAAGPRADLRVGLSRALSLRLAVAALVTLGRRTFVVRGYGDAFETPPVSGVLSVGPALAID